MVPTAGSHTAAKVAVRLELALGGLAVEAFGSVPAVWAERLGVLNSERVTSWHWHRALAKVPGLA